MATTADKLAAGALVPKFVVLIEGYSHPLSDATEAQVQAVMVGTDWEGKSIIPNVVVELENKQSIHPWNPFQGAGQCKLKIQPDDDDTFGIDLHRTDDGAESLLTADTSCTAVQTFVQSADDFPSSGEAHIGTECFGYNFKSSQALHTYYATIASQRGLYSPFGSYSSARFAHHHRVTTADNGVRLAPLVTEQPRSWRGRRVGVFLHHDDAGTLNSHDDALCVFAGFLSEPTDDESGWTHVLCEHELDDIKDQVCGRDMYEATLGGGHYLAPGLVFKFRDGDASAMLTANDLTVVSSGATGTNQINAGMYYVEEIGAAINAWLTAETAASRLTGNYTVTVPEDVSGVPRTVWHFFIPGTGSWVVFHITWPTVGIAKAMGYKTVHYLHWNTPSLAHSDGGSPGSPLMASFLHFNGGEAFYAFIDDESGTFRDNYPTMPSAVRAMLPTGSENYEWGLFLMDGNAPALIVARIERNFTTGAVLLTNARVVDSPVAPGLSSYAEIDAFANAPVALGDAPPHLRQIFILEAPFKTMLKWIFYSTGTPGYNHPTCDVLPPGIGIGRPYGLLGEAFEASTDALEGADNISMVVIDKPTKLIEVFKADLVLRRAHLVWRDEGIRFSTWPTPSAALAVTTLTEGTKAEAAGTEVSHRAPSVLDGTWAVNLIKLNYNRDATKIAAGGGDTFLSPPIILEDATSVDDAGGKPTAQSFDCRNVYADADAAGQGIRALAAGLLAFMPYFSRPVWKTSRSISLPYYEQLGVGDVVLITDSFVRDPTTGMRGIDARPALVVRHWYNLGGTTAGDPTTVRGMAAGIEVVFLGNDRTFAYAPCAEVDFSAAGSGYDGNVTLTCEQHAHSDSTEMYDVERFVGSPTFDRVKIVEVDPVDPANPDSWDKLVVSVTAPATLVINTALSSPAFSASKRYRIIYDSYADTVSQQHTKAYQAGTTGKIAETRTPHQYGLNNASVNDVSIGWTVRRLGTSLYHTDTPELPANLSYGPNTGAPRDTGYDKAAAQLLDNLMDHKTARSSPFIDPTVRSNTTYDGWQLLFCRPIFLGLSLLGSEVNRYMWIRPLWRSQGSGGAIVTVKLRITLTARKPTGASLNAVTIGSPSVSQEWNTQSNFTDWVIGNEKQFSMAPFNNFQFGYLLIEGSQWADCRGCPQVVERERTPIPTNLVGG